MAVYSQSIETCGKVACHKCKILKTNTNNSGFNSVKLKTELGKFVQIKIFFLYIRDSSYISLVAHLLVVM